MSTNALAFFTGLFGSLHCVAMCGPLIMALPFAGNSWAVVFLQRLLYQAGRIGVYVLLGTLSGLLGRGFNLLGFQQGISILTGLVLLFIAFNQFFRTRIARSAWQSVFMQPLIKGMGKWLSRPYGSFFAGMLNGLLPCGMVYLALAGAVNTDSVSGGGQFMLFFGLGTLPLLLTAMLSKPWLKKAVPFNFALVLPYLTLFMGIWFVLRGMELGIPYLSPLIESSAGAVCR